MGSKGQEDLLRALRAFFQNRLRNGHICPHLEPQALRANDKNDIRTLEPLHGEVRRSLGAFEEGDKLKPPQDRVADPVSAFQVCETDHSLEEGCWTQQHLPQPPQHAAGLRC